MPNKSNYEKAFSINVRKLRKKLNITQKSLADMVGYSEKTVSKWETEGSVPSIDALFRLANIFCVSIVELFRCDEAIYYLGIDGGGTKTEFALQTANLIATSLNFTKTLTLTKKDISFWKRAKKSTLTTLT